MGSTAALGLCVLLALSGYAFGLPPSGVTASGSGFFITADGYFLTNHHVVRDAQKIQLMVGESLLDAKIVRTDPVNDISVLKAEGKFNFLPLGRAGRVSLGQEVFTIGFPNPGIQGFAPKLTKGEISATTGIHDDPRLFQVSVPVQPGNSGGPIVDENGSVIGVISASLSVLSLLKSAGVVPQNVNYAIKISYASVLIDGVSGIDDQTALTTPEPRSHSDIIAAAEKAVGLVLVYGNNPTRQSATSAPERERQTKPSEPIEQPPPTNTEEAKENAKASRLIYAPFPIRARKLGLRGKGRFRICFARDGHATAVNIERSTGYKTLDDATTRALLMWRARPGSPFDLTVPMTFADN